MSKANRKYKQRTIAVDGQKIVIRSGPKTSLGNLIGWSVDINGQRFFCNKIMREEAEDYAYAKWVKCHA